MIYIVVTEEGYYQAAFSSLDKAIRFRNAKKNPDAFDIISEHLDELAMS